MSSLASVFTLSIALVLSLVLTESVDVQNNQLSANGGYVIWAGNCDYVTSQMLVHSDHVDLWAVPLYKRSTNSTWRGDKVIQCVSVLNMKGSEHSGTANITEGGYLHSFVTVYMESERGYGIEFLVNVYAS